MILNDQQIIEYFDNKGLDELKGNTIGLIGGLGSGKTHIVRKILTQISAELGKQVHSPTFNICNIYQSTGIEVHHYDLYRIHSDDDLFDIGLMESTELELIITFIEWIDLFPELIDCCDEIITITEDNGLNRQYQIRRPG